MKTRLRTLAGKVARHSHKGWRVATSSRARLATVAVLALLALIVLWPDPGPDYGPSSAVSVSESRSATPSPSPSVAPIVYTAQDGSQRTCTTDASGRVDCVGEPVGACAATPTGVTCVQATAAAGTVCPPDYTLAPNRCVWSGTARAGARR